MMNSKRLLKLAFTISAISICANAWSQDNGPLRVTIPAPPQNAVENATASAGRENGADATSSVRQFNEGAENGVKALDALVKTPLAPEGSEEALEGAKNLNEQREKAETVMNNPEKAFLNLPPDTSLPPPMTTEDFIKTLSTKNTLLLYNAVNGRAGCDPPPVICNGAITANGMTECALRAPGDNREFSEIVNTVGVFSVQCLADNRGRISSGQVNYLGSPIDLYRKTAYRGTRIVIVNGYSYTYLGNEERSGFCGPVCPKNPFKSTVDGKKCFGIPPLVRLCL